MVRCSSKRSFTLFILFYLFIIVKLLFFCCNSVIGPILHTLATRRWALPQVRDPLMERGGSPKCGLLTQLPFEIFRIQLDCICIAVSSLFVHFFNRLLSSSGLTSKSQFWSFHLKEKRTFNMNDMTLYTIRVTRFADRLK